MKASINLVIFHIVCYGLFLRQKISVILLLLGCFVGIRLDFLGFFVGCLLVLFFSLLRCLRF